MKQAFEQLLLNAVSYHIAALGEIALGVFAILYACFARRMTFEGDFPVYPEEVKEYKPTCSMRLYGVSLGTISVLFGLYGILFAEPAGVQLLHFSGLQYLHGFVAKSVVPHQDALSYAFAGIATVSWTSFGKRINREFFRTASKARIYTLALGVFLICCSIYACVKGH